MINAKWNLRSIKKKAKQTEWINKIYRIKLKKKKKKSKENRDENRFLDNNLYTFPVYNFGSLIDYLSIYLSILQTTHLSIYPGIFTHIFISLSLYIYIYMYMYIWMYICISFSYTSYINVSSYIYLYIYLSLSSYNIYTIYMCVCVCVCVCVCLCISFKQLIYLSIYARIFTHKFMYQ